MDNIWFVSALWMALAFVAAIGSLFITISAALFEIVIGALAGNTVGLPLTPWINYIAAFGAVVLTFLAGTDIDSHVVKRNFGSSVTIGLMGFFAPYLGWLLLACYRLSLSWCLLLCVPPSLLRLPLRPPAGGGGGAPGPEGAERRDFALDHVGRGRL